MVSGESQRPVGAEETRGIQAARDAQKDPEALDAWLSSLFDSPGSPDPFSSRGRDGQATDKPVPLPLASTNPADSTSGVGNGTALFDDLFGDGPAAPTPDVTADVESTVELIEVVDTPGLNRSGMRLSNLNNAVSERSPALLNAPADDVHFPVYTWPNLKYVIDSASPPLVAAAVHATEPLLTHLAQPLKDIEDMVEGPGWAQRIQQLRDQAALSASANNQQEHDKHRVIIGVVGRTGTGKSSIINAVLDEDRVLPTNGLRACTAVVTEIAWNASDDPDARYRAEIEFVQPSIWRQELLRLHGDLADEAQPALDDADDAAGDSTDADIALAKLQAVYPQYITSKESILSDASGPDGGTVLQALLDDARVNGLLGTVRTVAAPRARDFYTQLQGYLDSTARTMAGDQPAHADEQDDTMALWPLIRAVHVYVKSDVLSTGVVLVDLVPSLLSTV